MSEQCPNCQAMHDRTVDALEQVSALTEVLTDERRRVGRLQAELERQRKTDPKFADAKAVFDHWVDRLDKNANTKFGPRRQKVVLARLKEGHTVAELKRAVEGIARFPFVGEKGRQMVGDERQRYDDLELICRDEVQVAKCIRLADRPLNALESILDDLCDCGHPRIDHRRRADSQLGFRPCERDDCECFDFDDIHQRTDAWMEKQRQQAFASEAAA